MNTTNLVKEDSNLFNVLKSNGIRHGSLFQKIIDKYAKSVDTTPEIDFDSIDDEEAIENEDPKSTIKHKKIISFNKLEKLLPFTSTPILAKTLRSSKIITSTKINLENEFNKNQLSPLKEVQTFDEINDEDLVLDNENKENCDKIEQNKSKKQNREDGIFESPILVKNPIVVISPLKEINRFNKTNVITSTPLYPPSTYLHQKHVPTLSPASPSQKQNLILSSLPSPSRTPSVKLLKSQPQITRIVPTGVSPVLSQKTPIIQSSSKQQRQIVSAKLLSQYQILENEFTKSVPISTQNIQPSQQPNDKIIKETTNTSAINDPLKRLFFNNHKQHQQEQLEQQPQQKTTEKSTNIFKIRIAEIRSCTNENEVFQNFEYKSQEIEVKTQKTSSSTKTTLKTTTETTNTINNSKQQNDYLKNFLKNSTVKPAIAQSKSINDNELIMNKRKYNPDDDLLTRFMKKKK